MSVDNQFNAIAEKIQQLLKQQNRLKKENERLRAELESCKQTETGFQHRIDELSQQVQVLKFAAGEMPEKEKREFERKINQYIKEIDKCIAFLGQ